MISCDPSPSLVFRLCHRVVHTLLPRPQVIPLSSPSWGSSYLSETTSVGKEGEEGTCGGTGGGRRRKGFVEGLEEEGEGRDGRHHLFMLSISMGCLAACFSNSYFRMGVWAGRTGAADHVSKQTCMNYICDEFYWLVGPFYTCLQLTR